MINNYGSAAYSVPSVSRFPTPHAYQSVLPVNNKWIRHENHQSQGVHARMRNKMLSPKTGSVATVFCGGRRHQNTINNSCIMQRCWASFVRVMAAPHGEIYQLNIVLMSQVLSADCGRGPIKARRSNTPSCIIRCRNDRLLLCSTAR